MNRSSNLIRLLSCLASAVIVAGCVSPGDSIEERAEILLARGDYRGAIRLIEEAPSTAESRFALGLLYAFRELEERRERADFTRALELIRSASSEIEGARIFISDYEAMGDQVFYAFPWAHMIGPFPEVKRPQKAREPNQALQTTPMTRSVYEKTIEFGRLQRGV